MNGKDSKRHLLNLAISHVLAGFSFVLIYGILRLAGVHESWMLWAALYFFATERALRERS